MKLLERIDKAFVEFQKEVPDFEYVEFIISYDFWEHTVLDSYEGECFKVSFIERKDMRDLGVNYSIGTHALYYSKAKFKGIKSYNFNSAFLREFLSESQNKDNLYQLGIIMRRAMKKHYLENYAIKWTNKLKNNTFLEIDFPKKEFIDPKYLNIYSLNSSHMFDLTNFHSESRDENIFNSIVYLMKDHTLNKDAFVLDDEGNIPEEDMLNLEGAKEIVSERRANSIASSRYWTLFVLIDEIEADVKVYETHEADEVEYDKPASKEEKYRLYVPNLNRGYINRARTYLDLSGRDVSEFSRCYITGRLLITPNYTHHYQGFFNVSSKAHYNHIFGNNFNFFDYNKEYLKPVSMIISKDIEEMVNSDIVSQACTICNSTEYKGVSKEAYDIVIDKYPSLGIHYSSVMSTLVDEILNKVSRGEDYVCASCHHFKETVVEVVPDVRFIKDDWTYSLLSDELGIEPPSSPSIFDLQSWDYEPYSLQFISNKFEKITDRKLYMGVEIEMEEGGSSSRNARALLSVLTKGKHHAYAMTDGSLCDGIEIATMPATLQAHMDPDEFDYETFFKLALKLDYRSHDAGGCGIHVHINRNFFGNSSPERLTRGGYMALILENNWAEIENFSRRNYEQMSEWSKKKDVKYLVENSGYNVREALQEEYGYDKYVAFNINKNNTFEIRVFKGTLRKTTYFAILQFVHNLAHIVKNLESIEDADGVIFDDIINYKKFAELDRYCRERNL